MEQNRYFCKFKFPESPDFELAMPINNYEPCDQVIAESKFMAGVQVSFECNKKVVLELWAKKPDGTEEKIRTEKVNVN